MVLRQDSYTWCFGKEASLLMGILVVRMCCNLDRWLMAVEQTSSPDAGRL
jgi:hypothetical protein